jgi:hypothetical protein
LLELATSDETMIRFIFNGQILGYQPVAVTSRSSLEISDNLEHDSNELNSSEISDSFYAEVFGVMLPNQQSNVCVRVQMLK